MIELQRHIRTDEPPGSGGDSCGRPSTRNKLRSLIFRQAGGSGSIPFLLDKIMPEIAAEESGGQLPLREDIQGLILSSREDHFQTK